MEKINNANARISGAATVKAQNFLEIKQRSSLQAEATKNEILKVLTFA